MKGECAFGASRSALRDVVGFEKGAYDLEFVENCWWWWWVKGFCWGMFCFIIFVSFWFPFGFWYFILCFCFKGNKKLSEDVGFNSNIKDSSIKDGVDGDEVLKDSNLAIFIILIYVGFIF